MSNRVRKRAPGAGRKPLKKGQALELVAFGLPAGEHLELKELSNIVGISKSKLIRNALKMAYNIGQKIR